ncbi:hypothetical protein L7F22_000120 [Adiantum nelumboides]|nr:hypothetical protein [Adiantum nelumboides]
MWAFANGGDTFAATAFTSYGAFWLSYAALAIPWFGIADGYGDTPHGAGVFSHAIAIYLLGWTIFTLLMFVASTRTSRALCLLFALVALTLTLLTIAQFGHFLQVHRAGGIVGILTAAVAWYTALAELLGSQLHPLFALPLGHTSMPAAMALDSQDIEAQ